MIAIRKWLLLLLLVLLAPVDPFYSAEAQGSAIIISNQVDLPAAQKLEEYLESHGYQAEIKSPEAFWSKISAGISPIFVLGGPDAYEGVGEISRQFLTEKEIKRLRSWKGFGNFYIRMVNKVEVIILAGNTREETFEIVESFEKIRILEELFTRKAGKQVNPFVRRKAPQLVMRYTWQFRGKTFHMEVSIPESLVDYYRNRDHDIPPEDWYVLASDPLDDKVISELTWELTELALEAGYTSEESILQFVIRFVQALPYSQDVATTGFDEYPRFPLETLVDGGGDCEDTSILMATILMELGYDVVLFLIPGHVAVGVGLENGSGFFIEYEGNKYYYLETTGYGWNIGELPPPLQRYGPAHFTVLHPVHVPVPLPVISRVILVSIQGEELVVCAIVVVENRGHKEAVVDVSAGFKGAGVLVIHTENSGNFTVLPGEACTISINLQWPEVIRHRWVVIRLLSGGKKVDEVLANF